MWNKLQVGQSSYSLGLILNEVKVKEEHDGNI